MYIKTECTFQLTQMSQDYVEEVAWFIIKNVARRIKKAFFRRKKDKKNDDPKTTSAIESGTELDKSDDETVMTEETSTPSTSQSSTKERLNNEEINKEIATVDEAISQRESRDTKNTLNESAEPSVTDQDLVQLEPLGEEVNRTEDITEVNEEESNERRPLKDLTETNNAIFFHSSIFFIWVFVTILNIPAVLTWAHNFK